MVNERNYSKHLLNSRGMDDYNIKMGLNEFVGNEKSDHYDINDMKNLADMSLAMAYVPWQKWQMIYEPNEAFTRGTIFKQLDLPFEASKGCK